MSTSSSNSSLNYLSAAMPVALPLGFARPPTPPAPNTTKRVEELEERVTELEIQNETDDRIETLQEQVDEADNRIDEYEKKANGHWNAIVKAESKIKGLQLQVDGLIALVAQLMKDAPQPVNSHDAMIG